MAQNPNPWKDLAHGVISITSASAQLAIAGDRSRSPVQKRRDHFGVLVSQLLAHGIVEALDYWFGE